MDRKKKGRGKNTEPDLDDKDSDLSTALEDNTVAASKRRGKKGKKGQTVDDDEYDISAFDEKVSEDTISVSDNGVTSNKKTKKGKKGQTIDDDEYDVSALDDTNSVQSVESSQSREGSKKGKKGKQPSKPWNDDDDLMEALDSNIENRSVVNKGRKATKSKPNASFAVLEDVDASGDASEDESEVEEMQQVDRSFAESKISPEIKDVRHSGAEVEEDEELDQLIFSGKKKSNKKKGAKPDSSSFAESKDEDAPVFSGKKKEKSKQGAKIVSDDDSGDMVPGEASLSLQSDDMSSEVLQDSVMGDEEILEFTGKKKSKKGKKVDKTSLDEDMHSILTELEAPITVRTEASIAEPVKVDEGGADSVMADEATLQFTGKKKSKKGKKVDKASEDADTDTVLAELEGLRAVPIEASIAEPVKVDEAGADSVLADEETLEFTGKKKGKKGKKTDKASESADIDTILVELGGSKAVSTEASIVEPIKVDEGGASKKKVKKGKKSGRTAQEEEDLEAILAELDGPKPEPQPESSNTMQQEASLEISQLSSLPADAAALEAGDEADGGDAVESAAAKKKKKKKEKEKAKAAGKQLDQAETQVPEEKQEPPKSKVADKKVPKHVREMQERLARQREAEEKLRREEEERRRKEEEEQRRLEELEREREEAKRRRKEREKEKLLKKKQEGKLLTGKQKEEARRLALMREQLLAQKGATDLDTSAREDAAPKKPKYDNRKKRRPQGGESLTSTEQSMEGQSTSLPQDSQMEADVMEKEPEAEPEVVAAEPEETVEAEVEAEAEAEAEEEDEDWDAKSWDDDNIELPPVRSAFAEEEDEDAASVLKNQATKHIVKAALPAKSLTQGSKPTAPNSNGQQSDNDLDSEDETDSEDEGTDTKKRQETANKRAARKAEALAKRSADDLRSPICCILGHVDTGKTKLLDCIRRTNVQEGEAGGITQQIGATYFPMENILDRTKELKSKAAVRVPGLLVIDTPGHESFTNLRSRGSGLCDIAILVVDIMHGLEPQTIESLNLLKMRKTPFVVALNKVDRLYNWKTLPNSPIEKAFKQQSRDVLNEFENRLTEVVTQFKEQGINSELYYKNKELRKYVNIVPTSAVSGEGVPDLLMLLVHLTQKMMEEQLMYSSEVQATVLEVKVIEGLGTTIDVILVNGVLHEGDQIVVCGMQGPIVTSIRALLTPHPMKELRVKGSYLHHKELKAAQGIKLTAQGLEHAIAGSQLHVVGPDDDIEAVKEEAMQDMKNVMSRVDKSGEGVCVQASTLGSLEALLEFLKSPAVKIPVSGISIGPVHKRDVMRASVMLERKKKEYATILAFDVKVTPEAKELAEELGVKIFMADIIYHLFDQFTAYMNNIKEEKRKESADEAVFPCVLGIKPQFIFNKKDPIILGVDVLEGIARVGTPICVPNKEMIDIGRIASIEVNHKVVEVAKKGQAVAMKIVGSTPEETQKMFGRHFDHEDELVSHITRRSIDVLKENFRDELTVEEWKLVVKLKKLFNIP